MGKLTEIAYFSDDVDGMAAFYEKLLGAGPVVRAEGMAIFMLGGIKLLIHRTYTPGPGDLPPEHHHALGVQDVDAACRALAAQGLAVEVPPKDYDWGRSAYLRDPDGHLIELAQE